MWSATASLSLPRWYFCVPIGCVTPLSRDFKTTVRERVQRDPKFGEELFREAMECLLAGELETAKAILRDYVNATADGAS